MPTATATATISNRLGMHARPAMSFVDIANSFKADIKVNKDGQVVDGKSIMQLMMLAAIRGTELVINADGDDAQEAVDALKALIDGKFDEE